MQLKYLLDRHTFTYQLKCYYIIIKFHFIKSEIIEFFNLANAKEYFFFPNYLQEKNIFYNQYNYDD